MTQEPPDSSSDHRDDWDSHWDKYADSAAANPAQRWRRKLIVDSLTLRSGDRVLDIGSGQGDLAAALLATEPRADVCGLELSASGVALASAKVPDASFHQVDLLSSDHRVEGREHWADKAVCSEVLEHVDEPRVLLARALEHVKPGGLVVITVPAGPRTPFDKYIGHRRHFDRAALRELMEAAGIRVERIDAAGFPFFNLYRLLVLLRGKRVIRDIAQSSSGQGDNPAGARLVLSTFDRLFRFNLRKGGLGWQLIAVGKMA